MYVCIYVCVHSVYMFVNIHIYMYVYVCTCTLMRVHACMQAVQVIINQRGSTQVTCGELARGGLPNTYTTCRFVHTHDFFYTFVRSLNVHLDMCLHAQTCLCMYVINTQTHLCVYYGKT